MRTETCDLEVDFESLAQSLADFHETTIVVEQEDGESYEVEPQ